MAAHFLNCDFILDRIGEKGDIFEVYQRCIMKNASPHIKIKRFNMQLSARYNGAFPWVWETKRKHRNNTVPYSENYIWCNCDIEVEILQTIISGDVFTFLEDCLKDNPTKKIVYAGVNAIFHDEDEMNRLVNCPCTEEEDEDDTEK